MPPPTRRCSRSRYDPAQPRAFLPRDLFNPAGTCPSASRSTEVEGPWVSIGGTSPIVPHHAAELSRSAFVVLWNLPGGAAETRAYLAKLWDFPQPFVADQALKNSPRRRTPRDTQPGVAGAARWNANRARQADAADRRPGPDRPVEGDAKAFSSACSGENRASSNSR